MQFLAKLMIYNAPRSYERGFWSCNYANSVVYCKAKRGVHLVGEKERAYPHAQIRAVFHQRGLDSNRQFHADGGDPASYALAFLSRCVGAVGVVEFHPQPQIYVPFRKQRPCRHAQSCVILSCFHAVVDMVDGSADRGRGCVERVSGTCFDDACQLRDRVPL